MTRMLVLRKRPASAMRYYSTVSVCYELVVALYRIIQY